MKKCINVLTCFLAFGTASASLASENFGYLADGQARMKSVFSKFTEHTPDFSAVFQYQVLDAKSVPKMQMTMETSVTKLRTRDEYIVQAMPQIPAEHRAALKSAQMDRIVFLTCTDTKKMYVAFPALAAFQEFPLKDETLNEMDARSRSVTFQQTEIGSENVLGHRCMKALVEVTEPNHAPEKAVVWYASDLNRFPVRIAMGRNNSLHIFEFKNVHLTTPDPSLFQIPTNYTRVESNTELFRIAKERLANENKALPQSPQSK